MQQSESVIPVLSARGITKTFRHTVANDNRVVVANDNISIDLYKSKIHAIVGENGAGKSTFTNIIYGIYKPDKGDIIINGIKKQITSPAVAIKNGIGKVFQHFMLVETLTVAENMILGAEPVNGCFIDINKAVKQIKKISDTYGLSIDPTAKVSSLPLGVQQRVEILNVLYRGAEILILDEPTAILTPQEINELFISLRKLVQRGMSVILITHKLKEVMDISDTISVLRNGALVGSVKTSDTNQSELARMMVGRKMITQSNNKKISPVGDTLLRVDNLCCGRKHRQSGTVLNSISFDLKAGEILGVAGVDGNGQTELIEVLTGLRRASHGRVLLNGVDITNKSVKHIKHTGVSHIPEDRHKRGLVLDYDITSNIIMGRHRSEPFCKCGIVNQDVIDEYAQEMIDKFSITAHGMHIAVKLLSGGNQQKVVAARELGADPELLVAAHPTRGVDIAATEFIHKKMIELRNRGKGIILFSAELQEIMQLSDRIAVMYKGSIVDIVNADDVTEDQLGLLMAGIKEGAVCQGDGGSDTLMH